MRENEILWWVKSFFKGRLCLGIWCSIHLNVCTDVQHNSDGSKHLKKFRLSELCESLTWIRTTKGKRTTTIICIISFGNHILSVCLSRYSSAFITDVFTALRSKAIYYTSKIFILLCVAVIHGPGVYRPLGLRTDSFWSLDACHGHNSDVTYEMLEIYTYRNAKTPIKTIVFDGNSILTENVLKSAVNLNELKRSIYFGLNSTGDEKLFPSILSTTIIVMLIVSDGYERGYRFTVRSSPLVVYFIYRIFYGLPNSVRPSALRGHPRTSIFLDRG